MRLAATLRAISLTFLAATALTFVLSFTVGTHPPRIQGVVLMTSVIGLLICVYALARRGHLRVAATLLVAMAWIATTYGLVGAGGLDSPGFSFYSVCIAAAGLLMGARAAVLLCALSAATSALVGWAAARDLLGPPVITYEPSSIWWLEMVLFVSIAGLVSISVSRIREALADAERSGREVAERNRELTRLLAEKQQAEEAAALLHEAMDQSGEAIVVFDGAGTEIYANAALQALSASVDRPTGGFRGVAAPMAPGDAELRREILGSVAREGAWRGRFTPSGSRLVVDGSFSAVRGERGEVVGYAGVMRDVTRETRLEAELQQSQRLEALGRLAGGVAHDFNNLLVVIKGHAGVLEREAAGDVELEESARQIGEAADQAAKLTQQLLAFGRRQVQRAEVVNLNERVREAASMLGRLVPDHVEIQLDLADDLWSVYVDPGQIHQILMNLVANARDAMPGGGHIRIRTANIETGADARPGDLREPDQAVLLSVEDDGQGMDAETADRIFEPFFTTKGLHEGTGLGLATVYGIVEQCGGTIDVRTRPGEGASFRIRLPRTRRVASRPAATPRPPTADPRSARILIVEDCPPVRRMLRRIAAGQGYEILEASDGADALARLEEDGGGIDLLLTDVMMPHMDGPSLVARLRERRPRVGVVYTSGYAPEDLDAAVREDRLAEFVAKPFADEELVEKLNGLLARLRDGD